MEAKDRGGGDGGLIGGLPEELLLSHVVARLPWYTRPVCRAISKSWRALIDSCRKRPDVQLKSRKYQLPLLDGLVLICTFDTNIFITRNRVPVSFEDQRAEYFSVQWCSEDRSDAYQIHRQWRKLPPFQELFPPPPTWPTLIASSGMLYVWSNEKECNFVLKLDMGCGDWIWNKFSTPHPFNSNAIHFNGNIYVPRISAGDSANPEKKMVVAYDMMTEKCEPVEAWNCDNLRVSCSSSRGKEELLYSLVEHESVSDPKLEVLVYDACRNSWKTQEEIPIPECQWSELLDVKLLNGDCFEPVAETGTNICWIDSESDTISWINPSLHEDWVDINYNVFLEGRCLEYMQFIRGSMYGIFIEDKDGEDDEGEEKKDGEEEEDRSGKQDPSLFKRTLMKGTLHVASCIVMWEEVFEVGCMQEKYYLRPHVVSPINGYTLMA